MRSLPRQQHHHNGSTTCITALCASGIPPWHGHYDRAHQGADLRNRRGNFGLATTRASQQVYDEARAQSRPELAYQDIPRLPLEPRRACQQAKDAVIQPGLEQDRAYDAGRAHQNQERDGPDSYIPKELQRGYLRKLRHEHRWREHIGMLV